MVLYVQPPMTACIPKLVCLLLVLFFAGILLFHSSCEHEQAGQVFIMFCGKQVQMTIDGTKTNFGVNDAVFFTRFLFKCRNGACPYIQTPMNSTCTQIASFMQSYICFSRNNTILYAELYGKNVTNIDVRDLTILLMRHIKM
jgi:hypothetical protein